MINHITNVNSNIYSKNNFCRKNVQTLRPINFQGKNVIQKLPLTIPALSSIALINNNNNFKEYFAKTGHIPTYIWIDGKPTHNPELDIYIEKIDNLTSKEKKQFVKAFCEETGFPNLDDVQKKMDNEIKRAIEVCFKDSDAKPLFAGYSSVCSVGRAVALPGSDCDGLFIVSNKSYGKNVPVRSDIGNEINQRILDTQGTHYPELFAIDELMPYVQMADEIFEEIKTTEKIESYKQNLMRSNQDFIKAGEFNLDIASKINNNQDKNMMYLTAMFVELIRSGHVLINNLDEDLLKKIKKSALYKYSNIVRQEGFKDNIKPKWANRVKMTSEFNSKSDEEKFEICRGILKASMGIHEQNPSNMYADFDMGNISELNSKLTSWG